jgi:hypothetical protein
MLKQTHCQSMKCEHVFMRSTSCSGFFPREAFGRHFRTERLLFTARAIPGASGSMTLDLIAREKHRVEVLGK